MRMNRFDWLRNFFRVNAAPQPNVKREKREKTRGAAWDVTLPGEVKSVLVQAHTKSEARGLVKRELGLDRLPVGTTILRGKPT